MVLLSKSEIDALDRQIAHVPAATGVRVVVAEIGKSDTYDERGGSGYADLRIGGATPGFIKQDVRFEIHGHMLSHNLMTLGKFERAAAPQ